ncbi:phage gateway protein [Singulisphaera rosea]
MLDNTLIALIISTVIAQEAVAGIPGTPLKQAFQPTMQGVNTQPTAYLYKVGDRRVGFPYRADVWDGVNNLMIHTELQQYETTFQFSALATQYPTTPTQYTASDLLNLVAYCLQSADAVSAMEAQGVGLLRVTDVRNPYFTDDRQQNEACPSFDVTFTHKQVIRSTVPILDATEIRVATV